MKLLLSLITLTLTFTIFAADANAAQCRVDLNNGRGRTLETFAGHGYDRQDACRDARRDCRRAIRAGYYRGRYLTCEVRQPRRVQVTRTCSAQMISRNGRFLDSFTAHATGRRGMGVKAQACRKAQRRCLNAKQRRGRYGASCRVVRY